MLEEEHEQLKQSKVGCCAHVSHVLAYQQQNIFFILPRTQSLKQVHHSKRKEKFIFIA